MRVPNQRERVAIEHVSPDVEHGRFAVKRIIDEVVVVEADAFTYGHDEIAVRLDHRRRGKHRWQSTWMRPLGNDRWQGEFTVDRIGELRFRVVAWRDPVATWCHGIVAKFDAGLDVELEREEGAQLAETVAKQARGQDTNELLAWATRLRTAFDATVRSELDDFVACRARYSIPTTAASSRRPR